MNLTLIPTWALAHTLDLTRTEYWDPAGGGRNMIQETSTTKEAHTRQWMREAQKRAQNELYSSVWAPQLD